MLTYKVTTAYVGMDDMEYLNGVIGRTEFTTEDVWVDRDTLMAYTDIRKYISREAYSSLRAEEIDFVIIRLDY